ncbi:AfsR/SARP family transcriptional regulator [Streptomyces sp. ME19-01-6]|uniref:AfsR/SARP family transcriptional regulator n=1 Tax=Streptomyces sp. ME19-01-6 TaxID=3028686 RepID=UPI0029A8353C|nr:BTAD domain-containing putative transcriptional regulator [Streptomyces sp. ME19-01-6]MDX3232224.1 BTAD domain-containing putative transcriptional regulator [Streptomyces sp. ME19-01-6]
MDLRVLGPVEAWSKDRHVDLGHAKQRSVIAVLLVEANRVVPVGQLIDRVWGEEPPASVRSVLYGYVARLRAALRALDEGTAGTAAAGHDGARLARRSGGYVLEVAPDLVDLHRFRGLVAEAAAAEEDPARAAGLLRGALGLWRGEALSGLSGDWAWNMRERLGSEYIAARLALGDVELRLGRHGELLSELRGLAAVHPLDERVVRQLIVTLYRCERQAEALEVYTRTRERLADELGVDPGPELQALYQRILVGDLDVRAPAPPASPAQRPPRAASTAPAQPGPQNHNGPQNHSGPRLIPAELPRAVPGFTGRAEAVARLHALVPPDGPAPDTGTVVISAIGGTAGVGKTALAVHWGHQARDRFPDGQLYVDLRGFDGNREPLRPRDALGQLLRGLGLTPQEIPADEDEMIRRYRSLLVDRRMLILLDDAVSAEQVRPLLPGGPSCLVVVTSRNRLSGLVAREGAHPVMLDVLAPEEAHALLAAVLGEPRVAAEPDAVAELARLCGYLPLALRVAAAQLACDPGRRVADLAAELAEGSRLAVLELEDDERSAVRAAFDLSYRAQSPRARLLFRRLGLAPGLEFDAGAAAALLDDTEEQAAQLLTTLAGAHLIESRGEGRYGFHDLLREYACERGEADDPAERLTAARDRLYAWYLLAADAAGRILYPQIPRLPREMAEAASGDPQGAPHAPFAAGFDTLRIPQVRAPMRLADEIEAIVWLEAERANLLAVIERTAHQGPRAVSWHLTDALLGYFWLCLPRGTWQVTARSALDAAVAEGDRRGEAAIYYNIGFALWDLGALGQSAFHHQRAIELHRAIGWSPGEAAALAGLAYVEWEQARLDDALGHFDAALAILRELGQTDAEALALIGVGLVHRDMGRLPEAVSDLETALHIRRKAGVRYEANHLDNLGIAYWEAGRLREGLEVLGEAVAINEAVGYRNGHAVAIQITGRIQLECGRHEEGLEHGERALRLAVDTGNRRIQSDALNTIGEAHRRAGRGERAAESHERALLAARAAQNRRAEADSLLGLAAAYRGLGHAEAALARADEARQLAGRCGFRLVEGQALTELGEIHAAAGRYAEALGCAIEAVAVQRESGHPLGEARALDVIGRVPDAVPGAVAGAVPGLAVGEEGEAAGDGRARAARRRAEQIYAATGARPTG